MKRIDYKKIKEIIFSTDSISVSKVAEKMDCSVSSVYNYINSLPDPDGKKCKKILGIGQRHKASQEEDSAGKIEFLQMQNEVLQRENAILAQKNLNQQNSYDNLLAMVNKLREACASLQHQVDAKHEAITKLTKSLCDARNKISELKEQLNDSEEMALLYKEECEALETKTLETQPNCVVSDYELNQIKSDYKFMLENATTLFPHELSEHYSGEFKDAIIFALNSAIPYLNPHGRFLTIVQDLLEENDMSETYKKELKLLDKLKTVGVGDRTFYRLMSDFGFAIQPKSKNNAHNKWWYYGDSRIIFVNASTPSETKALAKNIVAEIKHILY